MAASMIFPSGGWISRKYSLLMYAERNCPTVTSSKLFNVIIFQQKCTWIKGYLVAEGWLML